MDFHRHPDFQASALPLEPLPSLLAHLLHLPSSSSQAVLASRKLAQNAQKFPLRVAQACGKSLSQSPNSLLESKAPEDKDRLSILLSAEVSASRAPCWPHSRTPRGLCYWPGKEIWDQHPLAQWLALKY